MSTAKSTSPVPVPAVDDPRRANLLEAALGVFARFGYRKTSMDEVAQAAKISRQGLYLHFANKEELFRATLHYAVQGSLAAARLALAENGTIETRLGRAFDEWLGRYIGRFAADAADLIEATETLAITTMTDHEKLFVEAVAGALRESGVAAAYKSAGITARQLAENLALTAKGLKHSCDSREAFREAIMVAVRITCAPLAIR